MAQLTEIRAALAAALEDVPGLDQVTPYPLSSPTPPSAHVVPDEVLYHQSFGELGAAEGWTFRVQAFLAYVDDIGSQQKADAFIDDGLVQVALEADRTLGGLVADLMVDRVQFRLWEPAGQPMVGCEWHLRVLV